MGFKIFSTFLLLSLGTLWNEVSAETQTCLPDRGRFVSPVEAPGLWPKAQLISAYYSEVKNGTENATQMLNAKLNEMRIKLTRLERSWISHFFRADPDEIVERYSTLDTLYQIQTVLGTVKAAEYNVSRLEYLNKLVADKAHSVFPFSFAPIPELDQVGRARYGGCDTWLQMLQADWQRYARKESGFDVNALKETLRVLKQTVAEVRKSIENQEPTEARHSNQDRLNKMEDMFNEYLRWIEKGVRLPYGSNSCMPTQYVSIAIDIAKARERQRTAFILDYYLRLGEPMLGLTLGLPQRLAEEYRKEYGADMEALVPANLTARYLATVELARLDALIEMVQRVRNKSAFYANQTEDYFEKPRAIDVLPIETVLLSNEPNVELVGFSKANHCLMWPEFLENEWKHYQTNSSKAATLRDTLQHLKQTALETKKTVEKLWDQVPSDNSRYLGAETELEMVTAEKIAQKQAEFFDDYLKQMNN